MSSVLHKRTAIGELFKAGNFRQDISKSLKVNRMLVWRTLKCYVENRDIQNRRQGRPKTDRTPKLAKFTREKIRPQEIYPASGKRVKCVVWNHANCSPRSWRCLYSSMSRNTNFLLKLLTNDSKDARFFFPAFTMARCQSPFSVMRKNSMLNTISTLKMIEFCWGMEMKNPMWWLGSVMIRP